MEDEYHYHIYFNDDIIETKRTYLTKEDNISKIKVILEYEFKSFEELFAGTKNKKIIFIKFNRKDIKDMKGMFYYCELLEELNISLFNSHNVIDMSDMLYLCKLLKNLHLTNFNTQKVIYIFNIFFGC